jgi:outer membrane protein insertion porin family
MGGRAYRGQLATAGLAWSRRLVAAVALMVGHASAVGAQSSIEVEGNRRIEVDTIRAYFRASSGGYDAAAIDAGLKAAFASGQFVDVRIRQADGRTIVTVVEAPLLDKVAFEGNKRIKDDQLAKELQSKPHGTLLRPAVQADVQRIVEAYRRAARYDVKVAPKVIALSDNRVDLVFEISEGEKTTVREVRFVGNAAMSTSQLRNVIRTSETNLISFIKGTDVYDPDRVEADRDLIRRIYQNKGYADARVLAAQTELDPAKKGFVVTFTIDEGTLYRFGMIDVRSDLRNVDPAALRAALKAAPGSVYNADAVDKTIEALTVQLSKSGYAFAQARPRAERQPASRTIDVMFVVDEGPRTYVERIDIRGNSRTRDNVIRREFEIAEGDAYNKMLIDRARRRVERLGFFKTVKIINDPGSAADRVIVIVEVEEEQTGDFNVSGGYSTTAGFIAEVSVSERNFMGRGEYVKASVTYGQYAQGFDVSFVEPYFLGTRMSAGIDVFDNQAATSPYQSFGSNTYGLGLKLGAPVTEEVGVQWRYSLYNQKLTLSPALMDCSPANPPPGCYANGEASLPVKQAVQNGAAWVSATGSTVTFDTLDSKKNPRNGVHAELKQDIAGLGGDVKFLKTTGDVRYYHEIAGDVVGMARAQGGYVTGWGGQQVPLMNSFFGGPQYVRGFAPNGFGPRDLTPGTSMDNIGGTRFLATTAEAQAPVPGLPSEAGLKFAVFADAGTLWDYGGQTSFAGSSQPFQPADSKTIRSSVGAGLVWDSPFGALRIDYAVPLTKAPYDVTQPFRFSAGAF